MNPSNPNPFNPLENSNPTTPNLPADNLNPMAAQAPISPEQPLNTNIQPNLPNANVSMPNPYEMPTNNTQLPQPEAIPQAYGAYQPEIAQNQILNPSLQQPQPPTQLPQTVDPNAMFNSSTGYVPRQDLMGMPPEMPHASMNASSSSGNKVKLILIACGVFMLVILILVIVLASNSKSDKKTPIIDDSSTEQTTKPESKAIVATERYDLDKGCEGSPISNAASYSGTSPHKIALFEESTITKGQYSSSFIDITDKTWEVSDTDFTSVQLFGCLSVKSTTDTGRKCTLEDSAKKQITIGQYDVTYELRIIEAKTNKEVAKKSINGPAGNCPFVASYNASDPKLYGKPDKGSVNEAIKEYVTK